MENSGARDIRFSEVEDITGDPFDEAVLKRIEQAYDAYMGRTSDPGLKEEGTEALTHMREHGFAGGRLYWHAAGSPFSNRLPKGFPVPSPVSGPPRG